MIVALGEGRRVPATSRRSRLSVGGRRPVAGMIGALGEGAGEIGGLRRGLARDRGSESVGSVSAGSGRSRSGVAVGGRDDRDAGGGTAV